VLITVVAAWVALRKRRSLRAKLWLGLPRELEALRNQFQHSIEAAQGEARRAAKIGESAVAAMKPIETALRDFKKRITELEGRADASDKRSAEVQLSLVELEKRFDVKLDGVDRQLMAVTDQLLSLKQIMEGSALAHEKTNEELRAISSNLAAVQTQAADLSQRANIAETNQTRLSAITESMAKSVAALRTDATETAQRISTIEPRFLWKLEELVARVDSTLAGFNRSTTDDVKTPDSNGSSKLGNQAMSDNGKRDGNDQVDGAGPTADAPAKPDDGAITGGQPPIVPESCAAAQGRGRSKRNEYRQNSDFAREA